MTPLRALSARLWARLAAEADLVTLWAGLLVLQAAVPLDHGLGRADLSPWFALCLCAATWTRGRGLGQGAHPMLRPREHLVGRYARRAALSLCPAVVFGWAELSRHASPEVAVATVAATIAVIALRSFGDVHGQTAWSPGARHPWRLQVLGGAIIVVVASAIGALQGLADGLVAPGRALILGLAFLATGLLEVDPEHMWQRRAAGRIDGQPVRPELLASVLAFVGPALSWGVVELLTLPLGGVDFTQAYVASLHVVVWVGALWPRPEPVAMACLLHEVVPAGGGDPPSTTAARPFEDPPDGALRVSPLNVRRTRLVHPWIVPVRGARIARLDDPVRPLWSARGGGHAANVLGDARFEADPVTQTAQRALISLTPRSDGERVGASLLDRDSAITWRLVVLRQRTRRGLRALPGLYRWDTRLPEDAVQVIDPTTRRVELQCGDLLIVSAEGVAYGFELEIGAPIYDIAGSDAIRSPQIEDYVRAGSA